MIWHTVPDFIQRAFPNRTWISDASKNNIYLTFDDGPVPEVTEFVLDELAKRNQLATFFVVGDNVRKNPEIAKRILAEGHQIGNHTFHHLMGWKTNLERYLEDINKCQEILKKELGFVAYLFRPPQGIMTSKQAKKVAQNFKIIMWSVLSGDFSKQIGAAEMLKRTIEYSKAGSIVVFHDQEKTLKILPEFLPDYLDFIVDQGLSAVPL